MALETVKYICSFADEIRFDAIIRGLAEDMDIERKLNELYDYVENKDRAFWVSEMFRKAMLGNSIIVCCIMGLMLGDSSKENKNFSQEDLVLMTALEHFTDYDLQNIKEIMSEDYYKELENGKKCVDELKFPDEKKMSYAMTVEYCVHNRIFNRSNEQIGEDLYLDELIINPQAYKLLDYIKRVQRLMEYKNN